MIIIRQSQRILSLNCTYARYNFTRESIRRWFQKPKDELMQATDFKTFLYNLEQKENVPQMQLLTSKDQIWIMGRLFKKYFKYFVYLFFKMLYGLIDEYKRFLILGVILYMI